MQIEANTLNQLNYKVTEYLYGISNSEDETFLIKNELLQLNKFDFITTESQPFIIKNQGKGYKWIQRAFVNGYLPHEWIVQLAEELYIINLDIMITETLLDKRG